MEQEWKSSASTVPLLLLNVATWSRMSPLPTALVPGRWVALAQQGGECLHVQPDTKVPRRATHLSAWHLPPSSKKNEKQLSLTWIVSSDARRAPVQRRDCELRTWDVSQISSLLFKAMLFIASHQRPRKRLTHNHSNGWLEARKIKPGFSVILQWKLLFPFSKNSQRDFWNAATRSEGHQQLSWGHTVQGTVLTGTQHPNKQQNQIQYLQL